MACEAVQMWNLSGLVAAFLDLAIAYLLLCASAIVYFASKFLGFFGVNLPCPCDGMFVSKNFCFDRLLIDFPTQKISDVQLSVKHKYPFTDSKFRIKYDSCVEIEDEASCSSVSDRRKYDVKGKGVSSHRGRGRLRLRKGGGDHPPPVEVEGKRNGSVEDDNKATKKMRGRHRAVTDVEMNLSPDEDMHIKRTIQSVEELQDNRREIQCFGGDEKDTIRILEQKLEEERIARSALYIELEKERSAAATAADEAMAMILRLQEEKASIEMEARQYQRIIEEKSVYDAEEMNILKEILVRREMEKHFLEKEVEAYRQMVSDEGYSNDDPVSILHQLSAFADKKVTIEDKCSDGVVSTDKSNSISAFGTESSVQCHGEESSFEKDNDSNENSVKEMIFADKNVQMTSKSPVESERTIALQTEEEYNNGQKLAEKIIQTCNGNETGGPNHDPVLDKDTPVYDVHIVSDGTCFLHEETEGNSSSLNLRDRNSVCVETEAVVKRSSSEISRGLPPIGPKCLSLVSDLRRSSTSAMDSEMLKIDSEIGQLRERLKRVQEGREKLGLSLENREVENVQLKLLEDIAKQVQEIRCLAEPGKAARQGSLPLPRSKVLSKKRRSRSVSSGLQLSSEG